MSELIKIGNQEMSIKEWVGKRVVTFADIDKIHERPCGTARKRFRDNIKHFRLNIDYFLVKPEDSRCPKNGHLRLIRQNQMMPLGVTVALWPLKPQEAVQIC